MSSSHASFDTQGNPRAKKQAHQAAAYTTSPGSVSRVLLHHCLSKMSTMSASHHHRVRLESSGQPSSRHFFIAVVAVSSPWLVVVRIPRARLVWILLDGLVGVLAHGNLPVCHWLAYRRSIHAPTHSSSHTSSHASCWLVPAVVDCLAWRVLVPLVHVDLDS